MQFWSLTKTPDVEEEEEALKYGMRQLRRRSAWWRHCRRRGGHSLVGAQLVELWYIQGTAARASRSPGERHYVFAPGSWATRPASQPGQCVHAALGR